MAEEYTVTEVRLVRRTMPGARGQSIVQEQWVIGLRRPDGAEGTHTIPAEAFASRAAEYWAEDEDPPTVDQLLDIMLHEPYIPAEEAPVHRTAETVLIATADGVEEPAAQARTAGGKQRVTVHNARNHDEARTAHLERIDAAKQRVRIVSPKPVTPLAGGRQAVKQASADPLDVIRERATINPAQVAEIRRVIHQAREHAARGDASALQGEPLRRP